MYEKTGSEISYSRDLTILTLSWTQLLVPNLIVVDCVVRFYILVNEPTLLSKSKKKSFFFD